MKSVGGILFALVLVTAIGLPAVVLAAPLDKEVVKATIDFKPDTLNLCSQGQTVTVRIELPGYDVNDIDILTVKLNDSVPPAMDHPTSVGDYDDDDIPDLMVKFDRAAVQATLEPGDDVKVKVSGKLSSDIAFTGTDTIRAIKDCQVPVWYLDTELTIAGNRQMEKGGGPGDDGQTNCVTIESQNSVNNSVIWLADQAAAADVTFPAGTWVVEIYTDSDWGEKGDKCEVSIGGWNTIDGWCDGISITQTTIKWNNGQNVLTIELQADAATINEDDYLALKITNQDAVSHKVCTGEHSFLRPPDTAPGYPVPELATGILFGLGIVGLVGYLKLRRHQSTQIKT